MDPALAGAAVPAPNSFHDGLGERRRISDATGEPVELLCLRRQLTAIPSFEFALRERAGRLANFRHTYFGRVRSIDRLNDPAATLAVVSDVTRGVRLSQLLTPADRRPVTLDINAALHLIRQFVSAVAMLHENAPDVAHGAISPERLIVTSNARVVIVEYVLGAALEQLHYSPERYWKELRVALPPSAAEPRFDQRADVTQLGVVALSLVLGRLLTDEESPSNLGDVLASAWAISGRGGLEPLPPGLRAWLGRALQLDPRHSFESALDARVELDRVLDGEDEGDYAELAVAAREPAPPKTVDVWEPYVAAPKAVAIATDPKATAPAPQPKRVDLTPEPKPIALAPEPKPMTFAPERTPFAVAPEPQRAAASVEVEHFIAPAEPIKPAAVIAPPTSIVVVQEPRPRYELAMPPPATLAPLDTFATYGEDDLSAMQESKPARPWMRVAVAAAVLVALSAAGTYGARRYFAVVPTPIVTTGVLTVASNPAGAQVFVDNVEHGATPLTLTLAAGSHIVELRGAGEPRTIPITITGGMQSSQYIELPTTAAAAAVGSLQVRTEPAGAQVSVDGAARGKSPLLVEGLTPGEHVVALEGDFGTVKHTVTVQAATTASLVVPLTATAGEGAPVSGWVSLAAPAELQLYENKKLLGTSKSDRIMVSAGRHEIELVNEVLGYRASTIVQVSAGKVAPIKIEWPKGTIALNAQPWAEVWIDGDKSGETPIGNLSLPIGPHDIIFRHPDFGEQHHTITVSLSAPARLSVDLRKDVRKP